jgi:Zn-dependent protease
VFIDSLTTHPAYYFTVVGCVTASIVLHELGHGLAAIQQGDDTPRVSGHMTLNPWVHMGPLGLGLLCFVGIAFGVMPVDPRRFRSRYGDAWVAAAGPLVNGVIALLSLGTLAWLLSRGIDPTIGGVSPLWVLGLLNVVLLLFNLIPIAPLDGSAVVASFVPAYRSFLAKPENARYSWIAFAVVFLLAGELFAVGARLASAYVGWLAGAVA